MSPKTYPEMLAYKGQSLIVTDGTTLLGADDKAGVAEIMAMAAWLLSHPEEEHAPIAIAFTPDENYTTMVSGQWLTDRPYAVIHRIAVDDKLKGRGIAGWILEQAEYLCRQRGVESLKIDTHQDNTSMRRLLEKQNYHYCGVIQLHRDLSLRVAYEKRLDKK